MAQLWADTNIYAFNPQGSGPLYTIDTPPPTVSGELHLGHCYSYTQTDVIARFHHMSGKRVLYPMGFDDNGLPTERFVERTLKRKATEMDVMDTWATSSCTPLIISHWIDDPIRFQQHFPLSLRPQAHDIIRTWTFYTIVKGIYHFHNLLSQVAERAWIGTFFFFCICTYLYDHAIFFWYDA